MNKSEVMVRNASFFRKYDNGEGMFTKPLDGKLEKAEVKKAGGLEELAHDLKKLDRKDREFILDEMVDRDVKNELLKNFLGG